MRETGIREVTIPQPVSRSPVLGVPYVCDGCHARRGGTASDSNLGLGIREHFGLKEPLHGSDTARVLGDIHDMTKAGQGASRGMSNRIDRRAPITSPSLWSQPTMPEPLKIREFHHHPHHEICIKHYKRQPGSDT